MTAKLHFLVHEWKYTSKQRIFSYFLIFLPRLSFSYQNCVSGERERNCMYKSFNLSENSNVIKPVELMDDVPLVLELIWSALLSFDLLQQNNLPSPKSAKGSFCEVCGSRCHVILDAMYFSAEYDCSVCRVGVTQTLRLAPWPFFQLEKKGHGYVLTRINLNTWSCKESHSLTLFSLHTKLASFKKVSMLEVTKSNCAIYLLIWYNISYLFDSVNC